jgi:hypothetical protein
MNLQEQEIIVVDTTANIIGGAEGAANGDYMEWCSKDNPKHPNN